MNNEDKIHINSFKFYDRDELEELTKEYYLENKQLNEQLQQKEDIINKVKTEIKEIAYGGSEDYYMEEFKKVLKILDNKGEDKNE